MTEQLRDMYSLTLVGPHDEIVKEGTILLVRQPGILALARPGGYPCNTYKPGGPIKQATWCQASYGPTENQQLPLAVGRPVYLTDIEFKPAEIVFKLQTAARNRLAYKATVSLQLPKGYRNSMQLKDIQALMGQLFIPESSASAQEAGPSQPNPAQGVQQTPVYGSYVNPNGGGIQLNPDGSFSLRTPAGRVKPGHFTVSGDTLVLTYLATGISHVFRIQGDQLISDKTGQTWVREGDATAPGRSSVVVLKLPATYVRAHTPSDQIRLNADNSFTLQEGGQASHGTFAFNGNTLELTNSESNTKSKATLQGNTLTDSNAQTWVLRDQPAPAATPPAGPVLRNEDVIKLHKAGLDDADILAKIRSSPCQFDTSTDGLILLMQSGVSEAVINAMRGGGK